MKTIVFSTFLLLPMIACADDSKLKICLTGSTEKSIPNYGEAFVNGAKLAVSKVLNESKKVELATYYYDVTPLAAVESLERMRKEHCDAIIGFSTGNDLLAIEHSLKKSPILTLSIYGDPHPRFQETNYLRTLQPSAEILFEHLVSNLPRKIKPEDKILVVTAIDRTEMIEYKKVLDKLLKNTSPNIVHTAVMEQTQDITNFNKLIEENNNWDYVVLFTRSLLAAKITDIITEKNLIKKPILLGTKYFGSSELPAYFNFLKNKNIEAYFSRQNCFCDKSDDLKKFKTDYENSFNKSPMLISVEAYDATNFILKAINNVSKLDAGSLIRFFNTQKEEFKGIGSMKIKHGFELEASTKFLVKVSKQGYEGGL